MEAFTILFLLESRNRSKISLVFIHYSFLWIQTTSPPYFFCFWCVCFFVCFFFTFLCESNSNLLTRSQRALSCLILVRYSIKSLCYNPSSVLIAFNHIINFIFYFFFFQILRPNAYRRVLIGKCNFLNIFLMLFTKCVDFWCLTNDKFSHSLEF